MTRDITTGNPAKIIILFTIPLIIGNLFQQFYSIADTLIVGRILGINALAAVGCTASIMFLIIGFAQGLTAGFSIITAQRFGAKDEQGVRQSYVASIILSLLITVVLTIISVVLARPILNIMNTPKEIIKEAYDFIIIIYWGIITAMMFNLFSNVIRALGDSRTPLIILIITSILNIVLDFVLILHFSLGVSGAAFATTISQGVSAVLCIVYIAKKVPILKLHKEDWHITKEVLLEHLRIGLPMGFQASIIAIGAIIIQFALNDLGALPVAAYTAAQKIDAVAVQPMLCFGITMGTYVAQNYGANNIDRIRIGIRKCNMMSITISIIVGATNILAGSWLIKLFVGNGQNEVVSLAQTYLNVNGVTYFLLAMLFVYRYSLQGLGQSFVPTIAGIMELVMRMFAAIILSKNLEFFGVCLANPLAWIGSCVPLMIAYYVTMKKLNRISETVFVSEK
ncbi:putative efflux protein, MATE family [Clostridium pasteurianum DSM 525 = ATCC 6013]|uniref:Probable multidrug resistance protein NorM n=1 Tax=Clostridium pasteurianum DSM 525 = ATCC 6013 TaxID=1262449 RepID=A0A0H3J369_CLOPA|nr:MATE family efflux transporter [Clostridium pasteurianum]AJA47247.1 putative efflux protein, MATE family [Clostridium pasteurianum DSM 525 = ATCC 6013]AJA51235.1 putative efflux protein, MATE family [Clostridium pasteurianum DSM 525 = ATCC 6013]AOZ74597.1 MATE family efflux transporter [Clostridium pasteurianum DSM 525 = ATCC 6013]AOZ78394.1 MATE family efflux transporter [Clostridium pasteurianum]ELP59370.1 MATE efflux family protein [Clostridium pasteurianum DSM 525 = ATCC 6013]